VGQRSIVSFEKVSLQVEQKPNLIYIARITDTADESTTERLNW